MNELHGRKEVDFELRAFKDTAPLNLGVADEVQGLILNGKSDPLFDIYQNVESSKELWDSLEAKYMAEDASSKKFLVSNFTNYKMTDSRPVMKQYNELFDFKHILKHQKEELTLVELGSHLHIEESLKVYNDNKGKRKHQDTKADPKKKSKVTVGSVGKSGHLKKDCKGGKLGNKANGSGTNGSVDGSVTIRYFRSFPDSVITIIYF
ncbi:hypothetical protein Tco_1267968 [Tanacetum coccineum]